MTRTTSNLERVQRILKSLIIHVVTYILCNSKGVRKQNYRRQKGLTWRGRPSLLVNAVANIPKERPQFKDIWKPNPPSPDRPWNPCVEETLFRTSRFLPYLSHVTLHACGTSHPFPPISTPRQRLCSSALQASLRSCECQKGLALAQSRTLC